MSIITLTTDYGWKDYFVAATKAKIYSQYPDATIVDITHSINPFDILETAYLISAAYKHFPNGTVHIIGVDIEKSAFNKHIALQWNNQYFICADNGILSLVANKIMPDKMVEITIHNKMPLQASDMDVFVNVACHLAKGGLINAIGNEIESLQSISNLQPIVQPDTIKGHVVYIDHYGNVVSNISKKLFQEIGQNRQFEISFKDKKANTITKIITHYSDVVKLGQFTFKDYEGEKLALFNENDYLELAIFRSNPNSVGSAKTLLGLNYRDNILIEFKK